MEIQRRINVTQSSMPSFEEYVEEIRSLWETRWLTNMGAKHKKLEEELCKYLQVPHISLMVNGHMALEMVLQAFNLSGEVITTPFTFASTTHAIVRNGLVPIFCDIRDDDYTIDVSKIESLISERTSAIVPVHVYGNMCDVEAIDRIAEKYNIKVVYDAAHTFGVTYKGKGAASFGDASMLSFHATKVFHTIEGGAVCFKDEDLEKPLYYLKNFGIQGPEVVKDVGANAKMSEFQAAMGLCNLRHIAEEIEKRRHVAEAYQENLDGLKGIVVWKKQAEVEANYAYFPIRVVPENFGCTRDDVFERLAEIGVNTRKYFYPLTNAFDCYMDIGSPADTPVAYRVSKEILCLPIYAGLDLEDVRRICNCIRECQRIG